jgi:hypothetical protein
MVMKLPAAGSDGGLSHFRTLSQYYFRISWHTRQDIKLFYISVLFSVSSALTSYERYANRVMIQSKRKEKKAPPWQSISWMEERTGEKKKKGGVRTRLKKWIEYQMNWLLLLAFASFQLIFIFLLLFDSSRFFCWPLRLTFCLTSAPCVLSLLPRNKK